MKERYFVSTSAKGFTLDEKCFTWLKDAFAFALGCSDMILCLQAADGQVTIHDRKKGKVIQWMVTDATGIAGYVSPKIRDQLPKKLFESKDKSLDRFGDQPKAAGLLSLIVADAPSKKGATP